MKDDFFVGYLGRLPATGRMVVILSALGLLLGFAGGAFAVAVTSNDPGGGAIFWGQRLERTGVMVAAPYPHLRMAPTAEHPEGETLLMVRAGKRGVQDFAARFDGRTVDVGGVWTRRGDIGMIQINKPIAPSEATVTPPEVEDLGVWRLAGEFCDGKCYLGAMRPGVGLAHKACANLCIAGGAPAVLVTTEPVEGTRFLVIADENGAAPPEDWLFDRTALLVQAEGRIERRGSLLVFKMKLDSVRAL